MKQVLNSILLAIVVLILSPTFSSYLLGMSVEREDKSITAIMFIAALLNSAFIWWLLWKVFCN